MTRQKSHINLSHRDDEDVNEWFTLALEHVNKSKTDWAKAAKRQFLTNLESLPEEIAGQLATEYEAMADELEEEAETLRSRADGLDAEVHSRREEANRIRRLADHDFEFEPEDTSESPFEETLDILVDEVAAGCSIVLMEDDRVETLMKHSTDERVDYNSLYAPSEWYEDIADDILTRAGVDPDAGLISLHGGGADV